MELTGPKPTGTSRQSKSATERRHTARLVVHSPAYASLNSSPTEKARDLSEILDISEGGLSIQTSSPLEVDRDLNLCLDLSETQTRIDTTGRVVWSNSSGRAGIRFLKLPDQSLRQLKEWLFVNVLTAFDHARAWTAPKDVTPQTGAPGGPLLVPTAPQNGGESAPADEWLSASAQTPDQDDYLAGSQPFAIEASARQSYNSGVADLQEIAERALAATRSTGAAIALSVGDEMICQASAGSDAPPKGARLQASSGFSGTCVRSNRSLRCDDSEMDERVDRESCRALGIRSIVAVPIRSGSHVAGLIEVFSPQPYAFNAKDISVLQELTSAILPSRTKASHAATALPESQKTAAMRPQPLPVESPQIAEKPAAFLSETMNAGASPRSSLHKIILVLAALTFVFAIVWLIAPSITGHARQSVRTSANAKEPAATVSKPVGTPANVTDLASLRRVAEQGDPAAQFALGARYATGENVPQDYGEAVQWFARAADQGHILAQATLGAYYWAGRGVAPDLTKAYFWSALAQAGGDQASKYRVAVLTSRMTRNDILTAQQQANDWLRNHQTAGKVPPSH